MFTCPGLGWNCPIHSNQWAMQLDHLEGSAGTGPSLSLWSLEELSPVFIPSLPFFLSKHWEHCSAIPIQLLPGMRILEVLSIVRSWNGTWMERMCFQNNLFWIRSPFGGESRHRWLNQDMCQFLPHARHPVNPGCRRGDLGEEQRLKELKATILGNQRASPQR